MIACVSWKSHFVMNFARNFMIFEFCTHKTFFAGNIILTGITFHRRSFYTGKLEFATFTKHKELLCYLNGILIKIATFRIFTYFHDFSAFYNFLHILEFSCISLNFHFFALFSTSAPFWPLAAEPYRGNAFWGEI